jgi:signal transduction histidine kinase/HAMP domain-containing protein
VRQALSHRLLTTFALMLTLVSALVFLLAGLLIHHTTTQALEQQLARHLEAVASLAAKKQLIATYTAAALQGSEQARAVLDDEVSKVKVSAGVSEVVLFVPGDAGELTILAATRTDEAGRDRLLGRLLADAVAIEAARRDQLARSSTLYQDPLAGDLLSKAAYAPVLDVEGRPLAVVGIELPADFKEAREAVLYRITGLGTLAGAAVLAAAVFLMRQRVHVPLYRLVRAMQGDGDDSVPRKAKVRWPDEIGVLTEHYNRMVDRLAEKDDKLRELYGQAREQAEYLQGYSNHLVAGVPSGVVAVDTKRVVTVWNRPASEILRKTGEVGKPADVLLDADHPLNRALRAALEGSTTDQALIVLDDPGTKRWSSRRVASEEGALVDEADDEDQARMVELTCAPFRGAKGELLGAVALVTDRTELERFRRSASRNERLAAIGTLGAGLAHEIKNPLGAISGFAELIERKQGAEAARLAGRLRGEVEDLNRFLGEFLAFARDDTIRRETHDLRELILRGLTVGLQAVGVDADAAERALAGEPITRAGGAPLVVRLALQELPPMAVDGPLLRAAFSNLSKNAVQAMGDKGGELGVRLSRLDDVVYIRFRDQGPGIPLEIREKVFDPLFTTRAEGTGLGLAITHKTVTAHGGKISVRDAQGGGAELVIRLPFVGATAWPAAAPKALAEVASVVAPVTRDTLGG